MTTEEEAIDKFEEVAEQFDMNPRDAHVADNEYEGPAVEGLVEAHWYGEDAIISVPLEMEGQQSFEDRIEFMMEWYAGESEHQQEMEQ